MKSYIRSIMTLAILGSPVPVPADGVATYRDTHPMWSPDGQRIVFASTRTGNYDVFVANADGTDLRQLTSDTAADYTPAFAPDGNHVVFASSRNASDDIYRVGTDGEDLERLTFWSGTTEYRPQLIDDGRVLTFNAHRSDADGVTDIFSLSLERPALVRLTDSPDGDDWGSWQRGSDVVLFGSHRTGAWNIFAMNPDGSGVRRLTYTEPPGFSHAPSLAPSLDKFVYHSNETGDTEIYELSLTPGARAKNLTNERGADDTLPVYSPDGKKILFVSDRGGDGLRLFVMDADGTNVRRVL